VIGDQQPTDEYVFDTVHRAAKKNKVITILNNIKVERIEYSVYLGRAFSFCFPIVDEYVMMQEFRNYELLGLSSSFDESI